MRNRSGDGNRSADRHPPKNEDARATVGAGVYVDRRPRGSGGSDIDLPPYPQNNPGHREDRNQNDWPKVK